MSKFAELLTAAKAGQVTEQVLPAAPSRSSAAHGRPKGKRSDPSFEQVTAYIRRDTYLQTKMSLLQDGNDRDFSQLVEDLLSAYLRTQKSKLSDTQTFAPPGT